MQRGAFKAQTWSPSPLQQRKLTGIAPVFDRPYPLQGFKIIDAKSGSVSLPSFSPGSASGFTSTFSTKSERSLKTGILNAKWLHNFLNNWIFQDFWFVMNKLSIFGLMMGMMFLGAVFFGVGFLTAYKTLPEGSSGGNPWHEANAPIEQGHSSHESGLAHLGGAVVGRYAEHGALKGAGKVLNVMGRAQSKVPAPLQIFANHAENRVSNQVVGGAFQASHMAQNQTKKIFTHPGRQQNQGMANSAGGGYPSPSSGVAGNPYNTGQSSQGSTPTPPAQGYVDYSQNPPQYIRPMPPQQSYPQPQYAQGQYYQGQSYPVQVPIQQQQVSQQGPVYQGQSYNQAQPQY